MAKIKQNAEVHQIMRSQIRGAEYNPRHINPLAKKKLERGLKRFGLVGAIAVNDRQTAAQKPGSGWDVADYPVSYTIVGGHQRLAQLDAENEYDERARTGQDYPVGCNIVVLSKPREVELNLLLNNPTAQGEYDLALLDDVLRMPDINLEATGFDAMTLAVAFADDRFDGFFSPDGASTREKDTVGDIDDTVKAIQAQKALQAIKDRKKEYKSIDDARQVGVCYLVFTWPNADRMEEVMKALGITYNPGLDQRFQQGEVLSIALGVSVPEVADSDLQE